MVLSGRINKKIICKCSWLHIHAPHEEKPWSHEESHEGHTERTALYDGCGVFVGAAQCGVDLVVDGELLLVLVVGRRDGGGVTLRSAPRGEEGVVQFVRNICIHRSIPQ